MDMFTLIRQELSLHIRHILFFLTGQAWPRHPVCWYFNLITCFDNFQTLLLLNKKEWQYYCDVTWRWNSKRSTQWKQSFYQKISKHTVHSGKKSTPSNDVDWMHGHSIRLLVVSLYLNSLYCFLQSHISSPYNFHKWNGPIIEQSPALGEINKSIPPIYSSLLPTYLDSSWPWNIHTSMSTHTLIYSKCRT